MVLITLFVVRGAGGRHVPARAPVLHAVRRRARRVPGADALRLPVARRARPIIDIPFMAAIVWAGALEAARPRRGTVGLPAARRGGPAAPGGVDPVRRLLPLDELGRGLARALPLCGADRDRAAAAGPRRTSSSPATRCSRSPRRRTSPRSCERTKSGGDVLSALPAATCAAPSRRRSTSPACSGSRSRSGSSRCARSCRWCCSWRARSRSSRPGSAGLSVIVRYLLVPSVMMTLFAAVALGGWTMMPPRLAPAPRVGGGRRCGHGRSASPTRPCSPPSLERFNNELSFRGEQGRSLHRLLETGAVERGAALRRRCPSRRTS